MAEPMPCGRLFLNLEPCPMDQPRYPGNYPWDGTPAGDYKEAAGAIPGGYSTWDVFSWYGPGSSWGHKLDGTEITWWDGVKRKWDPQPDNRKAFFQTGNYHYTKCSSERWRGLWKFPSGTYPY